MKSAIIDIIYKACCENELTKSSEEYQNYLNDLCEILDKLSVRLGEDKRKISDDIFDCTAGMESEACERYFKNGVRYGARLMLDMLSDE